MQRNILIGCGALGAIVVVVLLVLIVLAVVRGGPGQTGPSGNSSGGSSQPSQTNVSSQKTQLAANKDKSQKARNKDKSQKAENKEYAVGDTIDMSDRTLRVNEAEPNYMPPNQFSRPQQGSQFVRANVSITNKSNGQISFNPLNFQLQDANGVQKNYRPMSEMPTPLDSGNLAPNGSVTGNMVFEAPQGATGLKLLYKPNMFSGETVTIDL